jgi:oxygen-independent coproporphyrinogen-3 oxidase
VSEPTRAAVADESEVGSYFVATYPPFSVWTRDAVESEALPALRQHSVAGVPLGLYLHIPFCRKRCHFCYFRVYTDKSSKEIADYLDVLVREWELYSQFPAIAGRPLKFVYFGGGTPSFLSSRQLEGLVGRLSELTPWAEAEEVTFECEPGTLTESKLAAIRGMGVTRLSLGVEHFDDRVLELNGRAHRSPEISRACSFARALEFPQINVDLIAGMLGDNEELWHECVRKTLELAPDSITVYQMELPFNTTISGDLLNGTGRFNGLLQSWATRRRWVDEAFATFERAGYHIGSAYTVVKDPSSVRFVYRDSLWQGADMVGLGVASFGHLNGVHVQNHDGWETYSAPVRRGELPFGRAYRPTPEERLIRELVLQLKKGSIQPAYFGAKYGTDVLARFREQWASLSAEGHLQRVDAGAVTLSRSGLLRVDSLLRRFFLPQHTSIRYT